MAFVALPGIPVDSLPSWAFTGAYVDVPADGAGDPMGPGAKTPFHIDEDINAKVALWQGKLWKLDVDAVGNTTNEALTDTHGVSRELLERAGLEVLDAMRAEGPCRTGEAVLTPGGYLSARHIVHSVGPRYSSRYHTAAESSLHLCYLNSLRVVKEAGLRSLALPPLYTVRKAYPRGEAAHVALRTARCFLDRFAPDFERVMFVVETDEDHAVYMDLMPLYFPRSYAEEHRAAEQLPRDKELDEYGGVVIAERSVRTGAAPGADEGAGAGATAAPATPEAVRARRSSSATRMLRDERAFVGMAEDPDQARMEQIRRHRESLSRSEAEEEDAQRRYATYLRRSKEQSLADVEQLGFIRRTGTDAGGRPIVTVLASALPVEPSEETMERLLLFVVRFMDLLAGRPFVLVYSHALLCESPDFAWLSEVFGIFRRRYQLNMHRLYVLHPSIWLKLLLFVLLPLMEDGFNDKITYCETTREIFGYFDVLQLRLPAAVVQYDEEVTAADEAEQLPAAPM